MPISPTITRVLAVVGTLLYTTVTLLPANAEAMLPPNTLFPAWSQCREKCDEQWNREVDKCRGKPMYDVCREKAMNRYSKCLAKCPPEEAPCPKE